MNSTASLVAPPRLFGELEAANYLGVSRWVIRAWQKSDTLRSVELPAMDAGGVLKRRLYEKDDLDALVKRGRRPV